MKIFILFLLVDVEVRAASNNVVSLNTNVADKSESTALSLQPSWPNLISKIDFDISLDAARSRNQVNYNPSVDDFTIEKNIFSAGADLTWNRLVTLGIQGRSESVNQGEVKSTGVTSKLKLRLQDFTFRASLSDLYVRQKQDFFILTSNVKDRLTLRNSKRSYGLSYYGFDSFSMSLNYSKYIYDTDVKSLSSALSIKSVLNKNGAAFLSQIYSLIDNETSFDLVYSFNDSLDLEISFSESEDFFDPYTKFNDLRGGATYYFRVFNLGAGISAVKTHDADDVFYSGDLTLSYNF